VKSSQLYVTPFYSVTVTLLSIIIILCLLQDTNPIFLFSKSTIEAQHPPSPSVHYGSGNKYVTSPFLFNKSTIEAQHPPSPSVHSGSDNKYVTSPFLFSKSTIEAQHPPSPSVHSGSGNKYGTDLSVGRKWEHIFPFFKIIIKIH
jgi:hypothetical protein